MLLLKRPVFTVCFVGVGGCFVERTDFIEQRELIQDKDGDGVNILNGDCDDENDDVFPDAEEICDGLDNDCDGIVDDDDPDIKLTNIYIDEDNDGFGDVSVSNPDCEFEKVGAALGGDCDDEDPGINPGVEEICSNYIDDNCDGSSNDCKRLGEFITDDHYQWRFDVSEGWYIRSVFSYYGADTNLDLEPELIFQESNETTQYLTSVSIPDSAYGDISYDPLFRIEQGEEDPQASYIAYVETASMFDWPGIVVASEENLYMFETPLYGDYVYAQSTSSALLGFDSVVDPLYLNSVGNVSGDAVTDVVVSVGPVYDEVAGYLFSADLSIYNNISEATEITHENNVGYLSAATSGGDLNADGFDDFLLAFPISSRFLDSGGEVAVFYGPIDETSLNVGDADVVIFGSQELETFGLFALSCVGDTNGDGFSEFSAGSGLYNNGEYSGAGRVAIMSGSGLASGSVDDNSIGMILGDIPFGRTSYIVDTRCGGDFDGDDLTDVAVGSISIASSEYQSGVASVFYGPISAVQEASTADAQFYGSGSEVQVGTGIFADPNPAELGGLVLYSTPDVKSRFESILFVPGQGL